MELWYNNNIIAFLCRGFTFKTSIAMLPRARGLVGAQAVRPSRPAATSLASHRSAAGRAAVNLGVYVCTSSYFYSLIYHVLQLNRTLLFAERYQQR